MMGPISQLDADIASRGVALVGGGTGTGAGDGGGVGEVCVDWGGGGGEVAAPPPPQPGRHAITARGSCLQRFRDAERHSICMDVGVARMVVSPCKCLVQNELLLIGLGRRWRRNRRLISVQFGYS